MCGVVAPVNVPVVCHFQCRSRPICVGMGAALSWQSVSSVRWVFIERQGRFLHVRDKGHRPPHLPARATGQNSGARSVLVRPLAETCLAPPRPTLGCRCRVLLAPFVIAELDRGRNGIGCSHASCPSRPSASTASASRGRSPDARAIGDQQVRYCTTTAQCWWTSCTASIGIGSRAATGLSI